MAQLISENQLRFGGGTVMVCMLAPLCVLPLLVGEGRGEALACVLSPHPNPLPIGERGLYGAVLYPQPTGERGLFGAVLYPQPIGERGLFGAAFTLSPQGREDCPVQFFYPQPTGRKDCRSLFYPLPWGERAG